MTRWLDFAWEAQGTAEIRGADANPEILKFFVDAGHPEITSDETSWCAAMTGACLHRAGVPLQVPRANRLLARSYLEQGTPIDEPRVGAIAVFTRGDPKGWQGHVGFVVGETPTHLAILGGNQADKVCVQHYPRAALLGLRWPVPAETAGELAAKGSRTVTAAGAAIKDAVKGAGAGISPVAAAPALGEIKGLGQSAAEWKGALSGIAEFAAFVADKWVVVAVVGALYFGARAIWRMGEVRAARVEDHNTGANVARIGGGNGVAG